jgi:hypothetical protein
MPHDDGSRLNVTVTIICLNQIVQFTYSYMRSQLSTTTVLVCIIFLNPLSFSNAILFNYTVGMNVFLSSSMVKTAK